MYHVAQQHVPLLAAGSSQLVEELQILSIQACANARHGLGEDFRHYMFSSTYSFEIVGFAALYASTMPFIISDCTIQGTKTIDVAFEIYGLGS
jgi:hypothetical protein